MGLLSKIFGKKNVAERKGEPTMVYIPEEDEGMNWAIEKANLTLWYFEESLSQPKSHQTYFSIKVKIMDGEISEHIWLIDPSFDESGNLFGVIGNVPVDVKTVQVDQKIGIDRSYISDWMIIEQGRLIGGYTIRAIRDGIPDTDKAQFDKSIGLFIDEGVDHFKTDFKTPEGAILSLEKAYDNQDLEAALACKDFNEEAKIMLSTLSMEIDEEMVSNTAEVLELSFINNIKEHGFPNFSNLQNAFPVREKIDDTHYIITEVCWFPDGGISIQKLNTYKSAAGWKVLGLVNED
ncbi:YegJ family protein [Pedobacter sp. R20-19]|uniref:YegJ family protein n=1 Tax=Pedobacter sp. R20-19 TaxID=1270196 RepID=UPI00049396FB|nr:DUF2314 domain-containing protein [Pedobacter sp. R20-19]